MRKLEWDKGRQGRQWGGIQLGVVQRRLTDDNNRKEKETTNLKIVRKFNRGEEIGAG